jgi:acid phosphatase type 7
MRRNYQRLAAACVLALVALTVCASLANAAGSDRDSDGIHNGPDNCPKTYNPDQKDLDGDGKGDVCDPDRDGDGQLDVNDPCPNDPLDGCVAPPPPPPDTTPPDTTITAGPAEGGTVTQANSSLSFSSSEANSTFSCQLDGGGFSPCSSPKSYSGLSNGSHTFEVKATDAAGNTDATPARRTWTVNATPQSDPVLVGAGDIARCTSSGDEATANLLDSIPGTVYTLGDNAYESGTATEFANCYDPSWGRHKGRTRPSPGNHEYRTSGASGYFGYFGSAAGDPQKGYYSYDLGQWHVVVLNSNDLCRYVSCAAGSAQAEWLRADLASNPAQCTLAYFHHPLFTSGNYSPGFSEVKPLWDVLYSGGAEVVLNGHDHLYERFAPQSPSGAPDPARGIREFVVGTGGASHYGISTVQPNSQVRNTGTFGVLKLTLHPTSYDWQFVPEAGKSFTDSGSTSCH